MRNNRILNVRPKGLARLLGIAFGGEPEEAGDKDEEKAAVLGACLSAIVPPGDGAFDLWPPASSRLAAAGAGPSLRELLTAPHSSLDRIRAIRRAAKRDASRDDSQVRHAVAIAIYYAAIAHALVFHDVKITTYSYEALEASLDKLITKPWIAPELVQLYRGARKICGKRHG